MTNPSIAYFVSILEDWDRVLAWTFTGVKRYAAIHGWGAVVWQDATKAGLDALRERHGPIAGCVVECSNDNGSRPPSLFGGLPLVYANASPSLYGRRVSSVGIDNAAVATSAFRELSATRPKAYAFVGERRAFLWSRNRRRAFAAIVRQAGAPFHAFPFFADPRERAVRLVEWIASLPRRTAIFAANDATAAEVASAAETAGRGIPGELALLGVDNDSKICETASPTLSSIQLDFERMGFVAAKMLGQMADTRRATRSKHVGTTIVAPACRASHVACPTPAAVKSRPPSSVTTIGPLLAERRESTGGAGRREPHVLAAIELIRREACGGLDARDVIARSPGSKSLFNLRFREATGHSVHDEIERVRLEKAFALLSDTDTAIGAISAMCGYRTDIALYKAFRLRTGMSMSEWRARFRT